MMPSHLSPDDFRALGKRAVDFIADYWQSLESLRVAPDMKPGDLLGRLPAHPPQAGLSIPSSPSLLGGESPYAHATASWDSIFSDLTNLILPALTHWQSPNFFAYFPANASFPAILGEMLSAGLAQQGMLWSTSPACTELEIRVLDWLAQMLDLPQSFRFQPTFEPSSTRQRGASPFSSEGGGVIQGTASESLVTALVAARHRTLNSLARASGSSKPGSSPHLVAYASTQAHSSFIKACTIVGLAASPDDRTHVRLIDTDDDLAMRPDRLAAAMSEDLAAGRVPFFVMGTIGTTSSTAIDPIDAIAHAMQHTCSTMPTLPWLHIDAAHAGSLLICPEFRHLAKGLEHADSFCFNPHKWLLTNFDCDCFYTRDRASLTSAMSVTPEYLRNAATDSGTIDYRDWHIPLGRRFRALKLWLVIRHYGVSGLQAHIREHVRLAELFESFIVGDPRFELAATRTMNLVCFRLGPLATPTGPESPRATDARNKALLDRLNATGRLFLTHTVLPATSAQPHPRLVLRFAIGATLTEERHVRAAFDLMQQLAGA